MRHPDRWPERGYRVVTNYSFIEVIWQRDAGGDELIDCSGELATELVDPIVGFVVISEDWIKSIESFGLMLRARPSKSSKYHCNKKKNHYHYDHDCDQNPVVIIFFGATAA